MSLSSKTVRAHCAMLSQDSGHLYSALSWVYSSLKRPGWHVLTRDHTYLPVTNTNSLKTYKPDSDPTVGLTKVVADAVDTVLVTQESIHWSRVTVLKHRSAALATPTEVAGVWYLPPFVCVSSVSPPDIQWLKWKSRGGGTVIYSLAPLSAVAGP